MTKEEIIRNLKYTMEKHKNDTVNTFGTNISVMCKDILDYLEQEPTAKENLVVEDCISRKDVMVAINTTCVHYELARKLRKLPTICPKSKTGHWIVYEDCEGKTRRCVCDRCGHETGDYTWKNPNFCEECGAKMVEPQESEDKE